DLERDQYVIVDFKTGKRSANDSEQLYLYARFIADAFNVRDLKQIELRNEYLADGTYTSFSPTNFDLGKVDYQIHSSMELMQSYLQDVENNVPVEIEQFPQNQRTCKRCCYREICGMA
ncbi:hypothetical protein GNF78_14515, partial [Clostridium perfringens]